MQELELYQCTPEDSMKIVSDIFEISGIGPHYNMEWRPEKGSAESN